MRVRTKSDTYDAWQWQGGNPLEQEDCPDWFKYNASLITWGRKPSSHEWFIYLDRQFPQSWQVVPLDWIIRNSDGQLSTSTPESFLFAYEPAMVTHGLFPGSAS